MTHQLTLQEISPVTHNVNRLTFPKPDGFSFEPGQATDLSILKDGWRDEKRPFTFTSLPEDDHLEFTIKSYPSHDGVTEQIAQLRAGDQVEISDAWGAITDQGKGVFIAGGAGVTPFIAILRNRATQGALAGNTLLLAAKQERDLILKPEWEGMDGLETTYVLSEEDQPDHRHGQIDLDLLNTYTAGRGEGDHSFYVCGPPPMVEDVVGNLKSLGVSDDRIVTED